MSFVRPTEKIGYVKEVLDKNHTIPNTVGLVAKARAKGIHLMYIPICINADYREMSPEPHGVAKLVKDSGAFQKGMKNVEIIDKLKPDPEDSIVEGKRTPDGFQTTNQDFHLRSLGIKNVAVAGYLSNVCVESTIRTAYEKGFNVIVLTDCTGSGSMEIQEFTVKNNFPTSSSPMTHNEFLAEVK